MNDDTRRMIYGTLVVFLLFLLFWLVFVYISACGFTLNCVQGAPLVVRTPIPTLVPFGESVGQPEAPAGELVGDCRITPTNLIGAWVSAGYPETEPFPFTALDGEGCEGTFEDVHALFVENSLWYPGSLGCVSCHNAELTDRSAGLDLTSYEAIVLGTRRVPESTSPGTDILGGGDWENSLLYEVLVNQGLVPEGHWADAPVREEIIYAGRQVDNADDAEVTATPTP